VNEDTGIISTTVGTFAGAVACLNGSTCTDLSYDFECACQDGYSGKQCEVDTTPPAHDTCETAVELLFSNAGVATHTGTTLYALDDHSAFCGGEAGADVVYRFDAATGQSISIYVSAEFTPLLALYRGTCGEQDSILECDDGAALSIGPQIGGTYWLVIDGTDEKEWGSFDLTVTLN
jgi:hypothetical protein